MAKDEDKMPKSSKYCWTPESEVLLKDFLAKWIWVRLGDNEPKDTSVEKQAQALVDGAEILKDITEQVEKIKNDPSIPTRSNKKTGARGKKEVREELQNNAREEFKKVALKTGYCTGKWLMFASAEKVDAIWSYLATSLIEGPLANTPAFCAKVSTSPPDVNPNYQHIMCLYMPDVYDQDSVTKVMKVLLRNHGFNLSGVKSDLYTLIGIDSKHPSGIPSTIWKNKDLMTDTEMKELKDAFFAELEEGKASNVSSTANDSAPPLAKAKPKPKKKALNNPFGSSDEEEPESTKTRPRANDEDSEEEQPRKKTKS